MTKMTNNIGAQYCVYEDSGTLIESINRIYSQMEKILILLNYEPWNGTSDIQASFETYKKIKDFADPENKIILISQHWKTEAIQRNFGKDLFHKMGIKWTMIIDDDELYNPNELRAAIEYLNTTKANALLVHQQVYWKTREYCIENLSYSMPTFVISDVSKVFFDYCRNIRVDGIWETLLPEGIVNHHLSYVRTDQQLLRKIETFSHANEERSDGKDTTQIWKDWFENVWSKWTLDMINLHVNPDQTSSFTRAIKSKNAKYKLL